ncbi:MAG: RNA polymerase factor sigma-54 [Suipraeoptans sp.]
MVKQIFYVYKKKGRGALMGMNINLSVEQKQLLSQSQIQSLELLSMCNAELEAFLNVEYMENPMLEQVGDGVKEDFYALHEKNHSMNEGYSHSDKNDISPKEIAPINVGEPIENYLTDQLQINRYNKHEMRIIDFLIKNIDDKGYYTLSLEESSSLLGESISLIVECLEDLRQLEPIGIFAGSLSSCLLRQLEVMGIEDPILLSIVKYHLEDISKGKISVVTRALKISSADVRKYIAFISTLNPKPLSGFVTGCTNYVIPDVILTQKSDDWDISLNDNWIGNYQLNKYYLKIISENKDEELQEYFRKKLERARLILSSIEQRRKTIIAITNEIVCWQKKFFTSKGVLKPMTMAGVGNKAGVHASTVSRAISGKYIQSQRGVFLMKDMFSTGVSSEKNGDNITAKQAQDIIRELVFEEDKTKPYSDQRLVELLKNKNIVLSRRVVAKYREEMGIRSSYERREYS